MAQDYILQLDKRIEEFVSTAYIDVEGSNQDMGTVEDSTYTYVSTPLIIWYEGGLETRISNNFKGIVTLKDGGKRAEPTSFKKYIEDFGGDQSNSQKANWAEPFNLKYNTLKNIKEAL